MMVQDDLHGEHSVCFRCGRKLTNENSREIGLGRVCRKKLHDKFLARIFNEYAELREPVYHEGSLQDRLLTLEGEDG